MSEARSYVLPIICLFMGIHTAWLFECILVDFQIDFLVFKIHIEFIMGQNKDFVEKRRSTGSQLSSDSRGSYNPNFKMMVINHAEATKNCVAGKKFGVTEGNVHK
jgi:hypothetical protein